MIGRLEPLAQRRLGQVDPVADRAVHGLRQRLEPRVLLVEVAAELVDPAVDVLKLVLEPVHPPRDTLEARGDAVEAAVELSERLGELVDDAVDRAGQGGDRGVLCFEPGQRLVETFREDADLGAVGELGQSLPHRAE